MFADNSVKVIRDQHGFSLQEVEDNYTKTTSIHLSHGRGYESKFSLLHTFEPQNKFKWMKTPQGEQIILKEGNTFLMITQPYNNPDCKLYNENI